MKAASERVRTRRERCFTDTGEARVSVTGDEDAVNLYVTVGEDSTPSDPTAASNDGSISGRSGTATTSVSVAVGSDAIVKAVAEDSNGVLGPVQSARKRRGVGTMTIKRRISALNFFAKSDQETWQWSSSYLQPRVLDDTLSMGFTDRVAEGSVITAVRARLIEGETGDMAWAELEVRAENGSVVDSWQMNFSGTLGSANIEEDTTPNHTVAAGEYLLWNVALFEDSGGVSPWAACWWVEVEFEAADVDQL